LATNDLIFFIAFVVSLLSISSYTHTA